MSDYTISLRGVSATGHHGVFEFERREGQTFVVDVDVRIERPVVADDVATTLDYGALATAIVADISSDPLDLIESLADRIAATCLAPPLAREASVTVHKPQAPITVPFTDAFVRVVRVKPC